MLNETIAHYRILRQLGKGGMGVVYEAEDTKLGRRVALKFLPEDTHRDPQALERFLREARTASALNHPGICIIHAIEEHAGRSFIAMELLEGQTLDKLIPLGSLPIPRTIDIGIQLADALDRSEEHTSELQSRSDLVCRLLLEKKKKQHGRLRPWRARLAAPSNPERPGPEVGDRARSASAGRGQHRISQPLRRRADPHRCGLQD